MGYQGLIGVFGGERKGKNGGRDLGRAGSTGHLELYLGGFVRAQWALGPVFLGTSLDLMGQSSRGLQPAMSLGVDLALRKGPYTRRGKK